MISFFYHFSIWRSDAATDKMRAMGFKNVLELDSGIAGWRRIGMPVAGE